MFGQPRKVLECLCQGEEPRPVLYKRGDMPEQTCYPAHSHEWGEFVYSFSGVIEITIQEKRYLVLPNYGIWVPPNLQHGCRNNRQAQLCFVYVAWDFCVEFCMLPCSVQMSPLMRSMLALLRDTSGFRTSDEQDRFLHVFMDQLRSAPCIDSYLPVSADPQLAELLLELEENPGDTRSVKELAQAKGMTDRTLARKCKKELGIPLLEWRQRLRAIKALMLLEDGVSVEQIALDFGYSSSSAFIAMFKRVMGKTPAEFHPAGSSARVGRETRRADS